MSIKWSSFLNAGELQSGCQVVGLTSSNVNARFDFPGTGIKDANGNYILRYLPATGVTANYLEINGATTGNPVIVQGAGADADVDLHLSAKGNGNIMLLSGLGGNIAINSTSAIKMPTGTTAQRPVGAAGLMRYNTSLDEFEYYDAGAAIWQQFANTGPSVETIAGTANRILITGTAADPIVNIDPGYVGQTSITTLGNISTGSWVASTIGVAHGGTGATSHTAYSVLCGGTSSTGAVQSVASTGNAFQVLTSNGAGALPSWQSLLISQICQGRLTLSSGAPVTATNVTAATTLYFTPYNGNGIGLYNGSSWIPYTFTERSIAIPNTSNQMYDVFIYDNAGTLTLDLTAWTNDTTRATPIVFQDGVYCKSGALGRRYLGSIRTTAVAGQTENSSSKRYVYNYYNRINTSMSAIETTASWTYTTAAFRRANNNPANQVEFVVGVIESMIKAEVRCCAQKGSGNSPVAVGIGINSTTVNSALIYGNGASGAGISSIVASYQGTDFSVGRNYLAWLEFSNAANTTTWYGTGIGLTGINSGTGLTAIIDL